MSEKIKIERDHYPEAVDNSKGVRRLELLGIKENLATPKGRRNFFAGLTDDQFQRMTGYVNSVSRSQPIDYEYEDGQLPFAETPSLEDKAPLMNLAFQTVREIVSDGRLDDQTALRRAGLTMAGAMNYIHPKENGNGRSGRIAHYLIEFGAERGDQAFNEELYAIIAKLPVYDSDTSRALDDTPPAELEFALNAFLKEKTSPEVLGTMSERDWASARVVAFLDMMAGKIKIPINQEVHRPVRTLDGMRRVERIMPGTIDGLSLYEQLYLDSSAIPHRSPQEVPKNAKRVMAEKDTKPPEMIVLPLDIM
jgi:hypothetical protein